MASNAVMREDARPVASPCEKGELVEIASRRPRSWSKSFWTAMHISGSGMPMCT